MVLDNFQIFTTADKIPIMDCRLLLLRHYGNNDDLEIRSVGNQICVILIRRISRFPAKSDWSVGQKLWSH